jgi:hypothetical protein
MQMQAKAANGRFSVVHSMLPEKLGLAGLTVARQP